MEPSSLCPTQGTSWPLQLELSRRKRHWGLLEPMVGWLELALSAPASSRAQLTPIQQSWLAVFWSGLPHASPELQNPQTGELNLSSSFPHEVYGSLRAA